MSTKATTTLILIGTLLVGMALGLVVSGTLAQQRRDRVEGLRGPGGFVAHMERVIGSTDQEQRAALRPLLEAADARNLAIILGAEADIAISLQEMARQASDLLAPDQRERLEREIARGRPLGPPPPGGGPGGEGGPPPPGRDGPPPEGGGPPPERR